MTIGECCETYELLAGFVAALEGELAASAPEVAKSMQEPVVLLRQVQAAYSELLSVVVQTAQARDGSEAEAWGRLQLRHTDTWEGD